MHLFVLFVLGFNGCATGQLASYLLFPLQNYLKDLPPFTLKWNTPTTRNPKHVTTEEANSAVDAELGKIAKKTEQGKIKWPANVKVSAIPRRVFTNPPTTTVTTTDLQTESDIDAQRSTSPVSFESLSQESDLAGFTDDEDEDVGTEQQKQNRNVPKPSKIVQVSSTTIKDVDDDDEDDESEIGSKLAGNLKEKSVDPEKEEINVRSYLKSVPRIKYVPDEQ